MNTKLYALLLTLACATGAVHASDDKEGKNPQEQPGRGRSNQTERLRLAPDDLPPLGSGMLCERCALSLLFNVIESSQATSRTASNSDQATSNPQELGSFEQESEKELFLGTVADILKRKVFVLFGQSASPETCPSNSPERAARSRSLSPNRTSNLGRVENAPEVTPQRTPPKRKPRRNAVFHPSKRYPERRLSTNGSLSRDSDTK